MFIFKDEIDEEEEMRNMRLENDEVSKLAEQFADVDVEDIDADDLTNPSLCAEYVKDIYKYMHKLEVNYQEGSHQHCFTPFLNSVESVRRLSDY